MNNDLSLIIPIKDRNEFTFRILCYLDQIKFPYKIFISDGSLKKKETKKITYLFKFNLKIEYLNFPYDKDFKSFLIKMYETLKKVKSKHVILLPNDDFINLEFLKKISKENKDNTISGLNLDFRINNFFKYINDFGRVKFLKIINKEYDKNLSHNNNIKRIEYIRNFHPFESVHLKKNLLKVFQMSLEFGVNNHKELMWFLQLVPLYYNNVIFLKKPLIARQINTYSSEGFNLHLKSHYSSNKKLEEFKKFVTKKFRDKKILKHINIKNFPISPNISKLRKIIIYLVYIKKFLSKYLLDILDDSKYNAQNYLKLYELVNKKFKLND